jgi:hypothetical protein
VNETGQVGLLESLGKEIDRLRPVEAEYSKLLIQYMRLLDVAAGIGEGRFPGQVLKVDIANQKWYLVRVEARSGQDTEGLKALAEEAACLRRANLALPEGSGNGQS